MHDLDYVVDLAKAYGKALITMAPARQGPPAAASFRPTRKARQRQLCLNQLDCPLGVCEFGEWNPWSCDGKALEIYSTIVRNGWVTVLGHAAYLGRELAKLAKAELALQRGWTYDQNEDVKEP